MEFVVEARISGVTGEIVELIRPWNLDGKNHDFKGLYGVSKPILENVRFDGKIWYALGLFIGLTARERGVRVKAILGSARKRVS